MDLTTLSLAEASQRIAQQTLSPLALTQAYLERIARFDPQLNSFLTVTADEALRQAEAAEVTLKQGRVRSPLHGIPIALKDLFDTDAIRTTAGAGFMADHYPTQNSAVAERLQAAGAILLGKLNMHEWAMSVTNANPHFGDCKNPWDLQRSPGGSSGGAGAALAARLCLGAVGSDTGGSVRIPASFCGVVGLKPTYGRISLRGAFPLSWSLDHAGPMGRRVRDVALLLQALAGYDPDDPYAHNVATKEYSSHLEAGVRGWRVAVAWEAFFGPDKSIDPEVAQAVKAALDVFAGRGAEIREVTLPRGDEATRHALRIIVSEAATYHHENLATRAEQFGEDVRQSLERGMAVRATDYILARRAQRLLQRQYESLFTEFDVLLTPATPVPAPRWHESEEARSARPALVCYTAPFNLVGFPALSLPCGFTQGGLPIGLQLVARPWAEDSLLRAGYAYEQATRWHLREPIL